jgi:MATE family multidrug resistance protein
VLRELKELFKVAGPAILTNVTNFGTGLTDTVFVGHLPLEACTLGGVPTQYLAGVGLANTWMSVVYFLAHGFNFAMDTLVSQNFGRGNHARCSELIQTALFVVALASIPVGIIWFFSASMLADVFELDEVTHAVARTFSRMLIFSLPGSLLFDALAKWNSNMQIVTPALYCSAFSLLLNAFMNWFFIYGVGLGFIGSPIATIVTRTVLPLILIGWLKYRGYLKRTWFGFSRRALRWIRIKEFVKYGAPAGGMIILEVGGFHTMTMMTGFLHDDSIIAAQIVAFNYLFICYFVPLGLAVATAARTGARIGAGDAEGARFVALVAQALAIAVALLTSLIMITARESLPYVFTDSESVAALSAKIFIFVAFVHSGDAYQGVGLAIVRGIGRQQIGFVLNLIAYYVIGLPLGAALTFGAELGVYGVWAGLAVALAVLSCMVVVYNFTIDWAHECHVAAVNAEKARIADAEAAQHAGEDDDDDELAVVPASDALATGGDSEAAAIAAAAASTFDAAAAVAADDDDDRVSLLSA